MYANKGKIVKKCIVYCFHNLCATLSSWYNYLPLNIPVTHILTPYMHFWYCFMTFLTLWDQIFFSWPAIFHFCFCNIFKYERIVNIFLKLKKIWFYMITGEWHYLFCITLGYLSKYIDDISISLKTISYRTFESQILKTNMCSYHQWGDQTFFSTIFFLLSNELFFTYFL